MSFEKKLRVFCSKQQADIIKNWGGSANGHLMIALRNLKMARTNARLRALTLHQIGRAPLSDGFVFKKQFKGEPECWVNIDFRGYRNLFRQFLIFFYNFPSSSKLPRHLHVDHVLGRKLARASRCQYVRLILIPGNVNTIYGSRWEKNLLENERGCPRQPTLGLAVDFGLMPKALGILPAKRFASDEFIIGVIRQLSSFGILNDNDLDMPFGVMRNAFRLGAYGIPAPNAVARVDGEYLIMHSGKPVFALSDRNKVTTWLNWFEKRWDKNYEFLPYSFGSP